MSRRPRPAVRVAVSTALVTAVVTIAAGCSDDGAGSRGSTEPSGSSTSSRPTEPAALATKSTIGKIRGSLGADDRSRLKERVTASVDAWLDGAFVAGDYPRSDFRDAFSSFTAGAASDARSDSVLMSNAEIGARLDAVVAKTRRLRIDVLANKGRAVGVTARFVLGLDLSGEIDRRDRIAGRLFMSYQGGGWRVFGYDVDRGRA